MSRVLLFYHLGLKRERLPHDFSLSLAFPLIISQLSRAVTHLQCNDPWPSCYQHQIDQRRSCLDGRFHPLDQNEQSPWYLVRDLRGRHEERTLHLRLRCFGRLKRVIGEEKSRARHRGERGEIEHEGQGRGRKRFSTRAHSLVDVDTFQLKIGGSVVSTSVVDSMFFGEDFPEFGTC